MDDHEGEHRPLGLLSLLAFGINGIVGVGIFFAPSEVAGSVGGYGGSAVYVLMALALLPIAWTYATLGGRFGVDGGPYVWAREAFGPTFAFFVGWLAYVSALFSTSAVMTGLGRYAAPELGIAGPLGAKAFALGAVVVLSGVASTGLRPSSVAWNVVTVVKLLPLVALAALAAVSGFSGAHPVPLTTKSVERAALMVIFALQGFEIVPVISGSTRRFRIAVPIATIASLMIASGLYALLHAACVRAVPALAKSTAPLVDAASALGGAGAARIVSAGANISAAGIAFGMIVLTPRYLSVLGRSEALGAWLGREDSRRVPQRALWITSLVILLFVGTGELGELFVLSSIAVLSQYAVCVASLAELARRRLHGFARRHFLPLPISLVVIVMCARGAEFRELGTAAAVLAFGGVLRVAMRHRGRRQPEL